MFAKIENNDVVEWPIPSLAPLFPSTSFPSPLTEDSLPDGYVMVGVAAPPQVGQNQMAAPGRPINVGGKWVQGWDVVDLTAEQIAERDAMQASAVRFERNQKLTSSDWTQVADAPVDQSAWAAYRQALRDVTSQDGFPWNIQWPEMPA